MDHTPDDQKHDGPVLPPARSVFTEEPALAPRLPSTTPGSAPTLPSSVPTDGPSPMFPEAASAPAPAPTTDGGAAPYLPAATPIAPAPAPAAEPAPFDAKAMVESQKRYKADPTYGPMPKGTEEGREAARKLREQANRKRRRSQAVSRVVALVVLAGLAVGGWFGYQAYQDRQDDEPDVAVDDPAAPGGEAGSGDGEQPGAGLTPLGVIDEQLRAQDVVSSGARTGIGGYLDSIDEARTVVDDVNDRSEDIADLTETPIIRGEEATAPGAVPTRLDVVVTRFDLSTPGATVAQEFVADVARDTYVSITRTADQVLAATETTTGTYHQYDARAGTLADATRGEASMRPGPDGLFVAPVTAAAIFPPEVVLHATAIDVSITDTAGADLVTTGYLVDIEGFTSAERQAAEDWLALLTGADPARVPSIAPGTVSDGEATAATASAVTAAADDFAVPVGVDASAAPVPEPGQAVVAWRVAENGFVSDLYVHLADGSAHWLYQVADFDPPPFVGGLLAAG